MEISNNVEGLRSLLGVAGGSLASATGKGVTGSDSSSLSSDSATLSSAASEVSQTASADGVRMDKVSSVQAALASGSYAVSASAVATKVVDAMLGNA